MSWALPSRTQVGVAIAATAVRAVAVRSGRVLWAATTQCPDGEIESALLELFSARVMGGPLSSGITVAVGPAHAQVKRLSRLPALPSAVELARVVQAGATRFFVHRGAPLVATGVWPLGDGSAWSAVVDARVVTAVLSACRQRGVRVRAITPTVVALAGVLGDGSAVWRDGGVEAELDVAAGQLARVRCRAAHPDADKEPLTLPTSTALPDALAPLAALDTAELQLVDAYAAAVLSPHEPLVIDLRRQGSHRRAVPRWRVGVAALAAAASIAFVLVGPGVGAARERDRATARLRAIAPTLAAATAREAALGRTTAALHELATFSGARRSTVWLLGTLAHTLPPDAMLVTARLDSAGGTFVALAPRAAQVLTALEQIPVVASPEIVGPVTHEWVAGAERERATVRFRWRVR